MFIVTVAGEIFDRVSVDLNVFASRGGGGEGTPVVLG